MQLLAVASFPACAAGASGGSLQVSWTVWEGACLTPKPLLRSTSLDSPVLKLPGFSLDPMTSYTVQVSVVSSVAGSAAVLSKASVLLQVGRAGVVAVIAGAPPGRCPAEPGSLWTILEL